MKLQDKDQNTEDSMAEGLINYVNPEYKQYNRPFLAALAVFITSYITVFAIFAGFQTNYKNTSLFSDQFQFQFNYGELNIKCINWIAALQVSSNTANLQTCKIVNNNYAESNFPEIKYCPGREQELSSCTGFNPLININYEKFSTWTESLGEAFGYVSILTTIYGIIIIFLLKKFGIIKLNQKDQKVVPSSEINIELKKDDIEQ